MYQASDFKGAVFTRTLSAHCISRACELASSFDKTLSYNTTIIDTTDTYQYHNLLICVPSCRLSGICWASLDADTCDSATRTTLLTMLIPGLQCNREDVAIHYRFQAQSDTVAVFT